MKRLYVFLLALLGVSYAALAQSGLGSIKGTVIDNVSKKPVGYAKVTALLEGIPKGTVLTDGEGDFEIKALQPGNYSIKVVESSYQETFYEDIMISSDKVKIITVPIAPNAGKTLSAVKVTAKKQLIDPDDPTQNSIGNIAKKPTTNINTLVGAFRGIDSRGGGTPTIRGSRPEGTAYYLDGVRVNSLNIPANALENIEAITGGTPAAYGDFVGGAISGTSKAPTKNPIKILEYRTASPFYSYLDNSHFNQLQGVFAGPLYIRDKGRGEKEKVVLGYLTSFNAAYALDGRLSPVDIYKVKDAKLKELETKPFTPKADGSLIYSAEYLTKNDLEKVAYRQNVQSYSFNIQGIFNFQPTTNINIKLGYTGAYASGRNWSHFNSLMNYKNNSLSNSYSILTYLQFTQFFTKKKELDEDGKEKPQKPQVVSDAFYTVRVSYERNYSETMDADHRDDVFKYGHLGEYRTYKVPTYNYVRKAFGAAPDTFLRPNGDTLFLTGYFKQSGFYDTAMTFRQANTNIVRGNYTNQILDYYGNFSVSNPRLAFLRSIGYNVNSLAAIQGLSNGGEPQGGVHSLMWQNVGALQAGYSKSLSETYILYVQSEASLAPLRNPKAKHNIQFGITYEQRFQRGYSLGADGLWGLMWQLANKQFSGLDSSKYYLGIDRWGNFNDTVRYDRLIKDSEQRNFDKKLREKLISSGKTDAYGNPITNQTYIDVNMYGPETYSLDMFTADELLNNGNSIVSYFGYDHLGNQVSGKPSINEFFKNRTLPAYQPVYSAAWLQDKFVFKDLILRLGVRVERFDANQPVLKDPYSMVPIYSAGEVRRKNYKGLGDAIPGIIGDDYKVYVNQGGEQQAGNTPLKIVGYRSGNNWYDKDGNPLTDPQAIYRSTNGTVSRNTPLLIDPKNDKTPTAESFKDYEPDIKVLPRIWFSFPISTTAQFFGTYDILTQRPGANVAQIDDYYYLSNRLTGTIANPDLKMTQVTDYEIGFRQQIGKDAALGIIASYREYRNLVQLYRYSQSWPYDYTTFGNLDFSTVKSIGLEYKLRELGNVDLEANYTLQFADGTGSNATQSSALVQTGLSTLRTVFPLDFDTRHSFKAIFDFHYKEGKKYNGPVVNGKKILENAGFNIIFTAYSGRPYTQNMSATPDGVQSGVVVRSQIKGSPNGANLPPQYNLDFTADKNFVFERKLIGDRIKRYGLRVFVTITNLFNTANVASVYRFTGSAYDDGYLNSAHGQQQIANATSAQSLVDLYNIRMVNPDRFYLPRYTRLGMMLTF